MKAGHERTEQNVEHALGRYRPLLDDWEAFVAASCRPVAPVLWAHPDRITAEALHAQLVTAEAVPWSPGTFRWPVARPGRHWAHAAGLYFVQEEASQLPVRLLDVRRGQRVLDLCAAPGGKTARIALALEGTGTVVANDRKAGRQAATAATASRLGLTNVVITTRDGTTFEDAPLEEGGGFDRVLVDAPCTAEGNLSGRLRRKPVEAGYRRFITDVQRALLRRAVALCRPGGRVVYSTCTYAPEENEAVVDAVLRDGDVELAEVVVPGLSTSPAVASFGDARWQGGGLRLWPHRSGTGGFFAAALDKPGETRAPREPAHTDPNLRARWLPVAERHGWPTDLPLRTAGRSIWWTGTEVAPPPGAVTSAGLCLVRRPDSSLKVTTEAAMRLGRSATHQWVSLTAEQVIPYQSRQSVVLAPAQRERASGGQVIVRYGPHALGMGMLRDAVLESEFPKAWAWAPNAPPDDPR